MIINTAENVELFLNKCTLFIDKIIQTVRSCERKIIKELIKRIGPIISESEIGS